MEPPPMRDIPSTGQLSCLEMISLVALILLVFLACMLVIRRWP